MINACTGSVRESKFGAGGHLGAQLHAASVKQPCTPSAAAVPAGRSLCTALRSTAGHSATVFSPTVAHAVDPGYSSNLPGLGCPRARCSGWARCGGLGLNPHSVGFRVLKSMGRGEDRSESIDRGAREFSEFYSQAHCHTKHYVLSEVGPASAAGDRSSARLQSASFIAERIIIGRVGYL